MTRRQRTSISLSYIVSFLTLSLVTAIHLPSLSGLYSSTLYFISIKLSVSAFFELRKASGTRLENGSGGLDDCCWLWFNVTFSRHDDSILLETLEIVKMRSDFNFTYRRQPLWKGVIESGVANVSVWHSEKKMYNTLIRRLLRFKCPYLINLKLIRHRLTSTDIFTLNFYGLQLSINVNTKRSVYVTCWLISLLQDTKQSQHPLTFLYYITIIVCYVLTTFCLVMGHWKGPIPEIGK